MEVDVAIKESPPPRPRRTRQREAPKSRFKGFDHGSDDDDDGAIAQTEAAMQPDNTTSQSQPLGWLNRSQRKRSAPERDIMDEVAPTAAAIKRMRLEAGEDPVLAAPPPSPPPAAQVEPPESPQPKSKGKGRAAAPVKTGEGKKGAPISDDDYLNQFLQEGQEEEANLRAERELLQRELAEGGIDFEDIREGTAVGTVAIRKRPIQQGSRCQRGQDDRWNPRWNGLRNFKKFGRQGRQQPRNIIPLEPVQPQEDKYAVGSDYWLEKKRQRTQEAAQTAQNRSQPNSSRIPAARDDTGLLSDSEDGGIGGDSRAAHNRAGTNSSPLPGVMDIEPAAAPAPSRSRKGKAAERASQTAQAGGRATTQKQKRAAGEQPVAEKPPKRRATTRATTRSRLAESSEEGHDGEEGEDDDSEGEGLNFRFGKRK